MKIRLSFVLLLAASAIDLAADDVYLVNGRSFKGVVAETSATQVHIQIAGGMVSIPASQVARVDKADSSLGEYLARKGELARKTEVTADDWLALARWARGKGLDHGTREAALRAAELDPRLEGLAPLLRGLGFVYDEQIDRYVSYDDFMVRRGFVRSDGVWITKAEHDLSRQRAEAELAQRRAAQAEAARQAREDRLAALAEISLLRDSRRGPSAAVGYAPPYIVLPSYWLPPIFLPSVPRDPDPREPPPHHRPPRQRKQDPGRDGHGGIRIPGSLIPFDGGR
jgi:hypothetical protein